ncbi:DHA2 family efflux MFS transporter permease subunit [Flavobacterium sp. xlx-214]|uniref:DHA2 family efflux MFS transporter permease subunit n=1 Tax=unclassified Flavobacterium TaxID=196869 RepID=UPI0013D439A1|nr:MULTISPECIES: DHA2 family efflux MFS transporter permease subunit [unclassified Flavobacterium]MBA5793808.1 DHA2 family efflux MFS transporter permease subunit [Flavobacterium sp. xlx-221]QMI82282.1 DHA2 family efflux MFS transporter permease subunit [Flavobacterium sp. xlx-214]
MIKENPSVYEKYLPLVTAVAMFMQSLDGTILNTSLPSIASDMSYSPLEMQSVIVSYTLTLALFIPLSGWLSDKYGTKKMFILAVALFTLGSVFCALSVNLLTLNLSRILQAIGGSMMVPIARLAILYQYPRSELLKIMNYITIPGLLGLVVGPSLGGFLSDNFSWHWIFLVNLPVGFLGIAMAWKIMPNYKNTIGKFDFLGLIYFSLALVFITLAMELSSVGINHYTVVLALVLLAGILFVLYYKHFKKTAKPIIDLNLFKIRTLRIGLTGSLITRFGISGLPFLLPLMMQVAFGFSASKAGMMLLPSALTTIAVKPWIVKLVKHFGYRKILISNTLFLAVIIFIFSFMEKETPLMYYIFLMIAYGAFTSIQMTAMNTISLADLTDDQASGGNSLLTIMQQLSISFGISIAALILAFFKDHMDFYQGDLVTTFHYTLITLAVLTALSSLTFTKLKPGDGEKLSQ